MALAANCPSMSAAGHPVTTWERKNYGQCMTVILKLSLEKTEGPHIGQERGEPDIELKGKKLIQRDSFVYLGGAVCGGGKMERVHRRVQAGANAWRAVEGVMTDRRISKSLKGKVMGTRVSPACLFGTETLELTELQQQRLQVCEKN